VERGRLPAWAAAAARAAASERPRLVQFSTTKLSQTFSRASSSRGASIVTITTVTKVAFCLGAATTTEVVALVMPQLVHV
jgi:hypothetical protein